MAPSLNSLQPSKLHGAWMTATLFGMAGIIVYAQVGISAQVMSNVAPTSCRRRLELFEGEAKRRRLATNQCSAVEKATFEGMGGRSTNASIVTAFDAAMSDCGLTVCGVASLSSGYNYKSPASNRRPPPCRSLS